MTLLERVQSILDERGLTIKQAERESGLSNATIRKWATQKPSLDSLIKLADYLHLSIDYIVRGDRNISTEHTISCDGVPLSESEADLVAMYRLLPLTDKKEVFNFALYKYDSLEKGKESIFSTYADTKEPQNGVDGAVQDIHKTGSGIA